MKKYRPKDFVNGEAITEESIIAFVQDFSSGSLKVFLKTQENPRSPASRDLPVVGMRGKTIW